MLNKIRFSMVEVFKTDVNDHDHGALRRIVEM